MYVYVSPLRSNALMVQCCALFRLQRFFLMYSLTKLIIYFTTNISKYINFENHKYIFVISQIKTHMQTKCLICTE